MSWVVASRYARALADVIGKAGNYAEALQELEDFQRAYAESLELKEVLETPVVAPANKLNVLNAILERLQTSKPVSNFLRILLAHYRLNMLATVVEGFRKVVNERLGIVEVQIFHARELTERERQGLEDQFHQLTGKKVSLEFHRDDRLIGGVLAQIGSITYDGSIRGNLERLQGQLATG